MTDNNEIITFETGWGNIVPQLDRLKTMLQTDYKDNKQKSFDKKSYMKVYTSVYNMCTQRQPHNWSERLYERHGSTIRDYLRKVVLPQMQQADAKNLLLQLQRHWKNHKVMNKWMRLFFTYLDRFYVLHHSLQSLEDVGTQAFRTELYDKVKSAVAAEVLGLIEEDRNNRPVDFALLRNIVSVFEAMGMGTTNIYQSDLEEPFLKVSREFYSTKGVEWVTTDDTPSYMKKTEQALANEAGRVKEYMIGMTESKILKVLEDELLKKHEIALLEKEGSGCKALLENESLEHLNRMYRLFLRIPDGLLPMAACIKSHIEEKGVGVINDRAHEIKESGKDSTSDPAFVQNLMGLHEKFKSIIEQQFDSNALFQKAMKEAFEVFVNRDAGSHSNAEMLACYCDRFLKSGGDRLTEKQVEEELDKVVQLFTFLQDKDMFGEIYRNLLAKRLLNHRSASDDAEKSMIGKLKLRCGAQFTQKMEGMINDLAIGKDHQEKFSSTPEMSQLSPDFSVQVLTTGFWPSYVTFEMELPTTLQACVDAFQSYYEKDTNHRKLKWVYSLGSSNVRMSLKDKKGKKANFDLAVSTLQASVLAMFHDFEGELSFEEVSAKLNVQAGRDASVAKSIVKKTLHSLSCGKHKVLKKNPKGKSINSNDRFSANASFKSRTTRIRIPMASLESSHNAKKIEEDRTHTIEAAIVRIMKTRKEMQHSLLISEVVQQLIFFKPAPKAVKRCIENLIDREYLERHESQPGHYRYLA
jgi:cullin 1